MSEKTKSALHIPRHFRQYRPELSLELRQQFKNQLLRSEEGKFSGGMPLLLSGKAEHALMMSLMNGDNWRDAYIDIALAHALTQEKQIIGPNVKRLGLFTLFSDFRQDRPSEKPVPGKPDEVAIVESQSSWTKFMAETAAYVARIQYLLTLAGHSHLATSHFQEVGIDVINLTSSGLMIQNLQETGFLDKKYTNIICGVDAGNLALTAQMAEKFKFDLAIISKARETVNGRAESTTRNELVYGSVKGKRVVLMDDMIDGAGTMVDTVELLRRAGAAEIVVCAEHAVFGKASYYGLLQRIQKYDEVTKVMTSNSLPIERPEVGGDKSEPYVNIKGKEGKKITKQVGKYDITPMIKEVVTQVLASDGNVRKIKSGLSEYVLAQEDPRHIYETLTKEPLPQKTITHVYEEGEHFRKLPKSKWEKSVK